MKKFLLIMAMILPMVTFTACSDDDKEEIVKQEVLFEEPSLEFGKDIPAIKNIEKRVLVNETNTMLEYKGEGLVSSIIYAFNNTGMFGAIMKVPYNNYNELSDFLGSKYKHVTTSDDMVILSTKDGKITVILRVVKNEIQVVYGLSEDINK